MINYIKWLKILIILPITLLLSYDSLLFVDSSNLEIGQLLILKIFERTTVNDMVVFVLIVDKLVYMIIFHVLYGNLISEEFRHNSVYVFTRISNRKFWFYKKSITLFLMSLVYTFLFLGTNMLICIITSTKKLSASDINTFFILYFIISLTLTFTTLIINLISIKFGNSIGFIVTYTAIVTFIFIALSGYNFSLTEKYPYLTLLNPMSGISSGVLEKPNIQILFISYYILLIILIILFGGIFINKLDIALSDAECK